MINVFVKHIYGYIYAYRSGCSGLCTLASQMMKLKRFEAALYRKAQDESRLDGAGGDDEEAIAEFVGFVLQTLLRQVKSVMFFFHSETRPFFKKMLMILCAGLVLSLAFIDSSR